MEYIGIQCKAAVWAVAHEALAPEGTGQTTNSQPDSSWAAGAANPKPDEQETSGHAFETGTHDHSMKEAAEKARSTRAPPVGWPTSTGERLGLGLSSRTW